MKNDLLAYRHIGISEKDEEKDVLFQGSIGRADLTGGNFDELIEHICSRLFILPNDTIVYPGHGAPTTIGIEKAENPFFR